MPVDSLEPLLLARLEEGVESLRSLGRTAHSEGARRVCLSAACELIETTLRRHAPPAPPRFEEDSATE